MAQVFDRVSNQVCEAHVGAEPRIPTRGVVHGERPVVCGSMLEPCEDARVHPIELAEDARSAQDPGAGARADRINAVEDRRREVQNCGKGAGAPPWKATEKEQEPRERWDQSEPQEDMKEELPIRPARVVARLCPGALRDRAGHLVKLPMGSVEVGVKPRA